MDIGCKYFKQSSGGTGVSNAEGNVEHVTLINDATVLYYPDTRHWLALQKKKKKKR